VMNREPPRGFEPLTARVRSPALFR